jgi:hypothetical protein
LDSAPDLSILHIGQTGILATTFISTPAYWNPSSPSGPVWNCCSVTASGPWVDSPPVFPVSYSQLLTVAALSILFTLLLLLLPPPPSLLHSELSSEQLSLAPPAEAFHTSSSRPKHMNPWWGRGTHPDHGISRGTSCMVMVNWVWHLHLTQPYTEVPVISTGFLEEHNEYLELVY